MLKHAFVNTHADGTDSTKTQPSNWNAEHNFDGGTHGALVYRDTGASNGANWLTAGAAGLFLVSNGPGAIPSWGLGPSLSTPLGANAGGTGVANNVANTITFTGAFSLGLTLSGNTSVTLPTSGTLLSTAAAVTPAQGGTGVANGSNNTITFSGNFALGLTLTGATNLTLPTSGNVVSAPNTVTFSGNFAATFTLTNTTTLTLPTSGTLLTTTGNGSGLTGLTDTQIAFTDNTTGNVSTSAHGYMIKAPNDATKLFQGDGTYALKVSTVTVSTTGNLNGAWFTLPKSGHVVLYMTNASLSTIQSIPAGYDGQKLVIMSQGAGQVDCSHNDAGGTTGQKLNNISTSGKTSLAAGKGTATYEFDSTNTRWNLIQHEQGDWIQYSASSTIVGWASFTTELLYYKLQGKQLNITWDLEGTSNSTNVSFTFPYTSVAGSFWDIFSIASDNGGTITPGLTRNTPPSGTINIFPTAGGGSWTATGTKVCRGQFTINVQ